jgi:hypothetical protein
MSVGETSKGEFQRILWGERKEISQYDIFDVIVKIGRVYIVLPSCSICSMTILPDTKVRGVPPGNIVTVKSVQIVILLGVSQQC